jgi:RES domain-containing protein
MRYKGLLYRALNPVYARTPLSGAGAQKYGGRFNRVGIEALYTSLAPDTALREANQVGTLQPTTLVALRADVSPVADARDLEFLGRHRFTEEMIADPAWRVRMLRGEPVPTQELADTLVAEGFAGIFVPSFARGASADATNLVLWKWEGMLSLVDDDDRLGITRH